MAQEVGSAWKAVLCPVQGSHAAPGQLLLVNTTEAFDTLDKAAAIKQVSRLSAWVGHVVG